MAPVAVPDDATKMHSKQLQRTVYRVSHFFFAKTRHFKVMLGEILGLKEVLKLNFRAYGTRNWKSQSWTGGAPG